MQCYYVLPACLYDWCCILFLAPAYWVKTCYERSRYNIIFASIVSACAIVQLAIVIYSAFNHELGQRFDNITPESLIITSISNMLGGAFLAKHNIFSRIAEKHATHEYAILIKYTIAMISIMLLSSYYTSQQNYSLTHNALV